MRLRLRRSRSEKLENPVEPREVLIGHQIREADVLLVSKTDLIKDKSARETGVELLRKLNPTARILDYSIRSGEGLSEIAEIVTTEEARPRRSVELDYALYATAEAEYGWYNGTWELRRGIEMNLEEIAKALLSDLRPTGGPEDITHAKLHVIWEHGAFKMSSVSGLIETDGQISNIHKPRTAEFTLNVRARMDPEHIERRVGSMLNRISAETGMTVVGYRGQTLIPSAPTPELRLCGSEGAPLDHRGRAEKCGNPACSRGCMHNRHRNTR